MVAVYNKELLSWYLITLKLRETVQNADASGSPEQQHQHQHQHQHHSKLQLLPEPLQVMINGDERRREELIQSPANPQESEWIISIKERLERASNDDVAGSWSKICIYRIPHFLRDQAGLGDDKTYIPQVVSIGPYHRGKRRLQPMERHKWRALHYMLKRKRQSIKLYIEAMQELEERVRACYEGPLSLTSNEFVEMLVLDGCFILEFFRGYTEGFENLGYERNDPIFAMRGMMYSIRRDMMMIENQIPVFVLEKHISLQLGAPNQGRLVADLAIIFFDPLSPIDEPLTARQMNKLESSLHVNNSVAFHPLSDQSGLHCLDVFRRSLLRKGPEAVPRHWFRKWSRRNLVVDHRRTQLIHCVTDLKESGIKFRKRKTDRFWDIKFKDGVLYIPRLLVHDGTKSLFLNLVAFEQCHLNCTNDITAYVVFMDNLIDSAQDVNYLHYCGILEHWLGNDAEVADMFNHLCQEVVFDINDSYLSKVSEEVNTYYNHRWNAWRASLKHKYFYNPWAVISFLAAVFLLLLTAAQTYYSVYGYYRPPN